MRSHARDPSQDEVELRAERMLPSANVYPWSRDRLYKFLLCKGSRLELHSFGKEEYVTRTKQMQKT